MQWVEFAIRTSSLKQLSREWHSRSAGKTVSSCFSTCVLLNLFIDFTADKEMNATPTWSVMEAHVSFHISKFQDHFDSWTRSTFLVHILPISSDILTAILMIVTGSHLMLDKISKWVRLTSGKTSTHHLSSESLEFCCYRRCVFSLLVQAGGKLTGDNLLILILCCR